MEMQQVKYFLALSKALNFTHAANAANVSQSALSRAIQQLEDEFGGPLFHRERGNTHLSELGRIMLPFFESIASHVEAAHDKAMRLKRIDVATLRIVAISTVSPILLGDLLTRFKMKQPGVEFDVTSDKSEGVMAALRQGSADVALVAATDDIDRQFHTIPLACERLVVVLSPNHPLATKNAVTIEDLDGQCYVHQSHCETFEAVERSLRSRGIELKTVFSSERDDWVQAMVRAGGGFTLMPESCVTDSLLLVRPLIEPEIVRTIVLATSRGRPHSPAVRAFLTVARSVLPSIEKGPAATTADHIFALSNRHRPVRELAQPSL